MSLENQLILTPPEGFVQEEVVTSFRTAAPPKDLKSPMVLQFQANVRPNLIVTRRVVPHGTSIAQLMSGVCADLMRHIEGLGSIQTTELKFKDGVTGLLLEYVIPAHEKFSVLQFQAGRVDGNVFTTMTISTEPSRLSAADKMKYLDSIASATVRAT